MENRDLLNEAIEVYTRFLKYLNEFVSEPAAGYELSFDQYLILSDVANEKELTLVKIANRRNVTRAAISRQVKGLLNKGLLTQITNPNDRRQMFLELTPKGIEAEKRIKERVEARFDEWVQEFGRTKAKSIIDFIHKFGDKFGE
ncbi:MAG: MarR family transcriptional regulator [Firmicutes bacterium]|uniref:MarR family transcriptional regulator n=1 Tax=Candidatus Gallilactobacillus intestinavium TaxID=2840838 RepID=A0A9D9E691_9LACO|nr:MarR family transcriptional regulator [Candidatus Gallilactobacillus intestinavium]